MRTKIFCIGFNKTGTTTLHSIFSEQLGYRSTHDPEWTYWTYGPNDPRLDEYDSFTDGESPFITTLRTRYPDARFILNTRPLKSWLISRHKAVERSRRLVDWFLRKYLPLGLVANVMNRWLLRNRESDLLRWIQIRNTYHRYLLSEFQDSKNLLVLNIESNTMYEELTNFLDTESPLHPEIKNKDGHGSTTGEMLAAIGIDPSVAESKHIVDTFFEKYGIDAHADCMTYFEDARFNFQPSFADRISAKLPFLSPTLRGLFGFFFERRARSTSYFAKWIYDSMIGLLRSHQTMESYTSIHRIASGSQ